MTELFDIAGTVYRDLSPEALKGLGRSITVPNGAVALAFPLSQKGESEPRLLRQGDKVKTAELQGLRMFRTEPFEVEVPVDGFVSQDGFALRAELAVSLSLDGHDADALEDFARTLEAKAVQGVVPASMRTVDLADWLTDDVRLGVKKYAIEQPVEALHEQDLVSAFEPYVRSALRKHLLTAGLVYQGLRRVRVTSTEWEELNRESAEARKREMVSQQRQRMRELWEKDRRRELLSKHELEEFLKALEHEGVIQDIERKKVALDAQKVYDEAYLEYEKQQHDLQKTLDALEVSRQLHLDRMRFEERLAQAKKAYETLKGASLEFFISTIDDEDERARLYKQLIAREMTPEQIAAMANDDQQVERLLQQVMAKIDELLESERRVSSRVFRPFGQEEKTSTNAVLLVCGKQVLAYDPRDYRTVERPNEVYDVSDRDLGSLRSVRVGRYGDESFVLAGARQGCYAIPAGNNGSPVREYAFFTENVHKGGTNSALIVHDKLFAAHSEQGLSCWPLEDPALLSVPLYTSLTKDQETTRALAVQNGLVYFATGGTVAAFNPEAPGDEPLHVWSGGGREVTAIVPIGKDLFAGNRQGQLLRWKLDEPGTTPEVISQEPHAIYMLKLAWIGGMPHLVMGSKAYGALVRSLNDLSLSTRYECDTQVRWVDAASDFVAAVSADQQHLFLWHTNDPLHPIRKITPGEKIQDMYVWTNE